MERHFGHIGVRHGEIDLTIGEVINDGVDGVDLLLSAERPDMPGKNLFDVHRLLIVSGDP